MPPDRLNHTAVPPLVCVSVLVWSGLAALSVVPLTEVFVMSDFFFTRISYLDGN